MTENCNLNCSMCIRGTQKGINISFDDIAKSKLIEEVKEHDIVITGGEPTLHPQFEKIVQLMCDKAKTVTVTTNGTINYYLNEKFLRSNLMFQVSLDGDEETHNAIRGKGSFQKTFSTLKKMDEMNVAFSVASVASSKNIDNMYNLRSILGDNLQHMKYWRISYEMPFGCAELKNIVTADKWNNFVDNIIDGSEFRIKIQKIFPFSLYDKNKEKLDALVDTGLRRFNCGSGVNKIYIYPDWNVYSCTCLTDFPIGNIKNKAINEILSNEKIKMFTNYRVNDDSICKTCEYLKYCNGGCIGMSYHYFGQLGCGDVRCPKMGVCI